MIYKGESLTSKSTAGRATIIESKREFTYFKIKNDSTSYNLYVSFDYGETWITIPTSKSEEFNDVNVRLVLIKSDGASQPFRIIYGW